ncbi:hypothetical protein AN958_08459 [Leucoagaricus sp. SymC.cos]|nr:hypothetical protein AN958_08459 [Leucoagaricus sp. SymC.cos]
MESLFIFLAAYAISTPIVLPLSSNALPEAKAVVTSLSVIWHTIAVSLVKDIALYIFSVEWMEQVRQAGRIVLDETDIVSRISAGYIDQIQHWISPTATPPFRLGFVSTLLLLVLSPLGPGTITVNSILLPHHTSINVANLTITRNLFGVNDGVVVEGTGPTGESAMAMARGNLITRLEMIENSTYDFATQKPNILIPWTSSDFASANNTIKYESDVITYNYGCSWQKPTLNEGSDNFVWTVNNKTYVLYGGPSDPYAENVRLCDPMILPLLAAGEAVTGGFMTAFLLVGQNATLDPRFTWLNLDNIPKASTTYLPENNTNTTGCMPHVSSIFTALVCDPQFEIHPATVSLYRGSLSAEIHPAGLPVVGNIPPSAANLIFADSLGDVLSFRSRSDMPQTNDIAQILFLADQIGLLSPTDTLPIHVISQNMDRVLLSSSKAYLSGFNGTRGNTSFPDFEMMKTEAVEDVDVLALGGSKLFLICLVALVGIVSLLMTLCESFLAHDTICYLLCF